MSSRTRKLAAIIGAATVASTAAFAIGTQVDGQAVAGGLLSGAGESRSMDRGGRGPDLSALATRLGVSTERLQAALEKVRPAQSQDGDRRSDKTAALAKELGVSTARVEAAMRTAFEAGAGRHNEAAFAKSLASSLKIDEAKVRSALTKARAAHEAEHAAERKAMAAELAKELNIPAARVETALAAMPRGGRGGHHGGPGMGRGGPGAERALTGDTATKVRRAALAEVSGGTIIRVETDAGGVYEAHVRKSDGTEVEVKVDRQFKVTGVEEHEGR